jgi:hypothetical protein
MRRATLALTALTLALLTSPALAHDGGQGTLGEANDRVVTSAGFLVIAFIPTFIFLMSLLQYGLDRRKDRRKAAMKKSADGTWPQGW